MNLAEIVIFVFILAIGLSISMFLLVQAMDEWMKDNMVNTVIYVTISSVIDILLLVFVIDFVWRVISG